MRNEQVRTSKNTGVSRFAGRTHIRKAGGRRTLALRSPAIASHVRSSARSHARATTNARRHTWQARNWLAGAGPGATLALDNVHVRLLYLSCASRVAAPDRLGGRARRRQCSNVSTRELDAKGELAGRPVETHRGRRRVCASFYCERV